MRKLTQKEKNVYISEAEMFDGFIFLRAFRPTYG